MPIENPARKCRRLCKLHDFLRSDDRTTKLFKRTI